MASQYNLLEYDSDEEKYKYPDVPIGNLVSAAFLVANLLERNGIPYGLMGGFAVRILGGDRDTRDVDIAFQAKMKDLWRIVEAEPRLILPNTKLISNILKAFVLTGPGHDDCNEAIPVEVDLIENGFQNSPRDLGENRYAVALPTSSGMKPIYLIKPFYLLRGKMAAFMGREKGSDMMDIQQLLLTFPDEIRGFADRLDPEAVTFFLQRSPENSRQQIGALFGR